MCNRSPLFLVHRRMRSAPVQVLPFPLVKQQATDRRSLPPAGSGCCRRPPPSATSFAPPPSDAAAADIIKYVFVCWYHVSRCYRHQPSTAYDWGHRQRFVATAPVQPTELFTELNKRYYCRHLLICYLMCVWIDFYVHDDAGVEQKLPSAASWPSFRVNGTCFRFETTP